MEKLGTHLATLYANKKYILSHFFIYFSVGLFTLLAAFYMIYPHGKMSLYITAWIFAFIFIIIAVTCLVASIYFLSHINHNVYLYERGFITYNSTYFYDSLGPIKWKRSTYKLLGFIPTPIKFMYIANVEDTKCVSDLWYVDAQYNFILAYKNIINSTTIVFRDNF